MNWSDVANVIGKAAPLVGSVLGGPAGAGIGVMVASALGVENTPEAVNAALGNPEALIRIKELESSDRQHLLSVQVESLRLELADIQNARAMHKDSYMPAVVTVALMVICGSMLYALLFMAIPEGNKDILIQSFGTMLGFLGSAIAFWVGTTVNSQRKTAMLGGVK